MHTGHGSLSFLSFWPNIFRKENVTTETNYGEQKDRRNAVGLARSIALSLSLSLVFPTTVCLNEWCALYYISPQPPLLSCAAQFPLDEKFKSHLIFFIIICVFVIYIEKETVDGQLS